jgi:hypothetical protein
MTDQPITANAKPVRKPAKKVAKPFLNDDERYGTQSAQIEMHAFLASLTQNERTTIEKLMKTFSTGQCFTCGYRRMIRYVKLWMQNQGKPVNLK